MTYLNDLVTLLPELVLVVLVLTVITADLSSPRADRWPPTPLTVFGLILAAIACVEAWGVNATVFSGFYRVDDLSVFLKMATMGSASSRALRPGLPARTTHPARWFSAILIFS